MSIRFALLVLTTALALSGCAAFSPDSGMGVVADATGESLGKQVAFVAHRR